MVVPRRFGGFLVSRSGVRGLCYTIFSRSLFFVLRGGVLLHSTLLNVVRKIHVCRLPTRKTLATHRAYTDHEDYR